MSFKANEIIVRDDGQYPEGALVVDGYDAQGNLLAHPLGGGFQLIIPPSDHSRFDAMSEAERTPIFCRSRFTLEGMEGFFEGWTDGTNWNGWAKPRFEFAEAQLIIAALGTDRGKYVPLTDSFFTCMDPIEPENWPAEIIQLPDGGTVKAYSIGGGSWIWDECQEEESSWD